MVGFIWLFSYFVERYLSQSETCSRLVKQKCAYLRTAQISDIGLLNYLNAKKMAKLPPDLNRFHLLIIWMPTTNQIEAFKKYT